MTVLLGLCLVNALVVLPWNVLVKPAADVVDVWLGFELRGWTGKLTALVHWAIYAAGAIGFWSLRPWMWPWAAVWVAQVAVSHLVWSEVSARGRGWPIGLLQAAAIGGIAVALWRARAVFGRA